MNKSYFKCDCCNMNTRHIIDFNHVWKLCQNCYNEIATVSLLKYNELRCKNQTP